MFPLCSSWGCRLKLGTSWRTHPFSSRAFCSGDLSFGLGRVTPKALNGPCPCTSSSPRCPVTSFPRFSHFAAALFTQVMYLLLASSVCLLCRTSSVQVL